MERFEVRRLEAGHESEGQSVSFDDGAPQLFMFMFIILLLKLLADCELLLMGMLLKFDNSILLSPNSFTIEFVSQGEEREG